MLTRLRARLVAWSAGRRAARAERDRLWRYERAELRLYSALCAHRYMTEDFGPNDIDYVCSDCGSWLPMFGPAARIVDENSIAARRVAVARLAQGHDAAVRAYMVHA